MNFRAVLCLLLIALLSTASKPLTFTMQHIQKTGRVKASRIYPYAFDHEYPVFHASERLASMDYLNKYFRDQAEKSYSVFIELLRSEEWEKELVLDEDSSRSSSSYFVHYASDTFVSMWADYDDKFPSRQGSYFGSYNLNYHVPSRAFVDVEDCFSFRKSPEAWIELVQAQDDEIHLDLNEAMPKAFTLDEDGVRFEFYRHGHVEYSFAWPIIHSYFVISECIPEELYLGAE